MELKLIITLKTISSKGGFNRTFMELKLEEGFKATEGKKCFNRTFMELKFEEAKALVKQKYVLIVPLWN